MEKPGKWSRGPQSLEFFADAQSTWAPAPQQHCLPWHFWKVLKIYPGKGAGRQPAFLFAAWAWLRSWPLFPPMRYGGAQRTPPPPPHIKERGNAHSSPRVGRRDSWEDRKDSWLLPGGESRVQGGLARPLVHKLGILSFKRRVFSPPGPRMPGLMPISPSLDDPS